MKKLSSALLLMVLLGSLLLAACAPADIAAQNLSTAADNFEITRRIVFYNGITGDYILVIEGLCALGNATTPGELSVICKVSPTEYKKHYLGLSDNVTYFAEQVDSAKTNPFFYRVILRPTTILPDVELQLP